MRLSNLPPGVSVNSIPGNRPEDEDLDRFIDAVEKEAEKRKITLPEDWCEEGTLDLVILARDLGYNQGFGEGRDEERMEQAAQEMEKATQGQESTE